VTETLELVPRRWKVIQHVREKLVCRACEAITAARQSGWKCSVNQDERASPGS
jgi:transposase